MNISRAVSALAAAVTVLALAGCAVGSSASRADDARALTDAVEQAASAIATATIAVGLLGDERITDAVADTALIDQIHVLEQSADAVSTLVPADRDSAAWQRDALVAVREAQVAIVAARGWANRAGTAADARAGLEASADQLDALTSALGEASGR
jgi:hypothetical protein